MLVFAESTKYSEFKCCKSSIYSQEDRGVLSTTPPESVGGATEVLAALSAQSVIEVSASVAVASSVAVTTAC